MGVYTRTNLAEGVSYYIAGAYSSGFGTLQLAFTTGTSTQWRINSTADYESSTAAPPGMFIVSRTAADACALYKNGALVEAVADASVALPVAEFYALNVRNGTANQISILYVMNGTANATEADEINDIIETYMDALGKGIQ